MCRSSTTSVTSSGSTRFVTCAVGSVYLLGLKEPDAVGAGVAGPGGEAEPRCRPRSSRHSVTRFVRRAFRKIELASGESVLFGGGGHLRLRLTLVVWLVASACSGATRDAPRPSTTEPPITVVQSAPSDDLLSQAMAFYERLDLPSDGIPSGFIETERLRGECIASFGFDVLEPELARESGVYYFREGGQSDALTRVADACRDALTELGVLLPRTRALTS